MANCMWIKNGCPNQAWEPYNECRQCKMLGPHGSKYRAKQDDIKAYGPEPRKETTITTDKYGLNLAQQRELLTTIQHKCCGICGQRRYLVLDHDHQTNKARGYLCRGCNAKLAGIDNMEFMRHAKEFLDNPPANKLSE